MSCVCDDHWPFCLFLLPYHRHRHRLTGGCTSGRGRGSRICSVRGLLILFAKPPSVAARNLCMLCPRRSRQAGTCQGPNPAGGSRRRCRGK
eukprot:6521471-Heterocapsa_arctica.AAC.1